MIISGVLLGALVSFCTGSADNGSRNFSRPLRSCINCLVGDSLSVLPGNITYDKPGNDRRRKSKYGGNCTGDSVPLRLKCSFKKLVVNFICRNDVPGFSSGVTLVRGHIFLPLNPEHVCASFNPVIVCHSVLGVYR